jgi:hypoxanthine phosphoribosyltransferase
MGFGIGIGAGLSQRLSIEQAISLPPTNWSLLDAFRGEGDKPLRFKKIQLDISGMSLEERLRAVDDANEVFRFAYTRAGSKYGERKGRRYKIPLTRDRNVEFEDTKIPISREEYDRATTILNGAGGFQRIARAVPYSQLYHDVKEFIESQGCTLDEAVLVGVDRGGRLPSLVMREALGKSEGDTLKVDQSGGSYAGLDTDRLNEMIRNGILKDRFVLFVDSTVDSGRQIQVLRSFFDSEEWKSRIGHKGWGIAGSNENGKNLCRHKNINWGLDPDESFEDDPNLMGVDYAPGSRTKVVDYITETSEAIRKALLEVPKGVILDFSNVNELMKIKLAYAQIDKALNSKTWQKTPDSRKDLGVSGLVAATSDYQPEPRKKLLVIGNGREMTLSENEVDYLVHSLGHAYDIIAGTDDGNPGKVLEKFSQFRKGSAQLYQPAYSQMDFDAEGIFGGPAIFHGETKEEFRENLVQSADAVLVLGGNEGTLNETILSLYAGKPVYILASYGAVGNYVQQSKSLRQNQNLHLADTLPAAVQQLREISK